MRPCFPTTCRVRVYDNLIDAVRNSLPAVHRYYDVRRRKMKLDDIHHYDTYVPILSDLETQRTWDEAVQLVIAVAAAAGRRVLRGAGAGADQPLVRPLSQPGQAERCVQLRLASTAIRTS